MNADFGFRIVELTEWRRRMENWQTQATKAMSHLTKTWPNIFHQPFTPQRLHVVQALCASLGESQGEYASATVDRGSGATFLSLGMVAWAMEKCLTFWPLVICSDRHAAKCMKAQFKEMATQPIMADIVTFRGIKEPIQCLERDGRRPDFVLIDNIHTACTDKSANETRALREMVRVETAALGSAQRPISVLELFTTQHTRYDRRRPWESRKTE